MNIEFICYLLCGLIPLTYLIIYVIKENKKSVKKRNYLYGLIVTIILALILFVIKIITFDIILDKKENKTDENTTSTTIVETASIPTSTTTTSGTNKTTVTTTKKGSYDYASILTPTGGTVLGKTSKGYEIKKVNGIYYIDGYLVANKTYDLPSDYNPGKLNATVSEAANKMFAAAKSEKGFNLYSASGFRSYDTQKNIYNRYVKNDGQKNADTYSARPGHSEHQTGLAFDVCDRNVSACITSKFDNTEQAKWLSENAYKYGFILRYPKGDDKVKQTGYMFESWHFRYVGTELAEKLYNNGDWITVEDYFGITSSYDTKPVGA